jgi:hypothetical protein
MAGSTESCNQLRIILSRQFVLLFGDTLALQQISVDRGSICQVKGKRTVNLFQCDGWVTLNHALSRHALTEQIH